MSSARLPVAVALFVALAACGGTSSSQGSSQGSPHTAQEALPPPNTMAQQSPAPASFPADLPPLPQVSFPAARPMPVVEAVFRFAAEHPEVLSKMPCFCGCENRGHKHNDDCFVAARDQRGRVTAWEPHGIG